MCAAFFILRQLRSVVGMKFNLVPLRDCTFFTATVRLAILWFTSSMRKNQSCSFFARRKLQQVTIAIRQLQQVTDFLPVQASFRYMSQTFPDM